MTRPRVHRSLVVLLAIVLLAPIEPAHARPADETYAATAVTKTNQARARKDLKALGDNACLRRRALQQAKRMAREGVLTHQDLGGVQRACGMGYVGENVAVGYATGQDVVRAWLRSPGHRANILSPHYRQIGVAAVEQDGTWWAAQVFGTRA